MSSAFSNLLSLHNLSEEVANAQLERLQRLGDLPRQVKSTNGTLQQLVASGVAPEHIYKTLCEQKVDLVFTAHPTQALRRSMLKNHQQIRRAMGLLSEGEGRAQPRRAMPWPGPDASRLNRPAGPLSTASTASA